MKHTLLFALLCTFGAAASAKAADESKIDNGTNPTVQSSSAGASFEYLDLGSGINSQALKLTYVTPFGANKDYSLLIRVPVQAVGGIGNGSYGIGDTFLRVSRVFGVTSERGLVLQGEMVFDTASRDELGTGQNVFKGTFIYAKFLKNGDIFAPAIVQSNSLWGDDNRADINSTTLDFYYVPKLANPKNLLTLDPSLNFDWENNREFAGFAITLGRVLGPMLGGNGIVTIKPSVFAGSERPSDWGVEVGFKVIGF
jgi:hypothetical protein